MSRLWARFPGLILGAGLGALLPSLALLLLSRENPAFVDHLRSLIAVVVLPPQALFALLLAWRAPRGRATLGVGLGALVLSSVLLGQSVAAGRGPRRWKPALVVVALPAVSWGEVERAHLPTVLDLARRGATASFEPELGGLDGWITLDSGIDTMGRPWLGERPTAEAVPVARWWQVADWAGSRPGLVGWPVSAPPEPLRSGPFVWPMGLHAACWPEALNAGQAMLDEALAPSGGLTGQALAGWRSLGRGLRWSTARDGAAYLIRRATHRGDSTLEAERPLLRARMERDLWTRLIDETRPDVLLIALRGPAAAAGTGEAGAALNQADQLLAELLSAATQDAHVAVISEEGWAVFAGPRVSPRAALGRVKAIDLAPTLLGLLDLAPARDMRGVALFGGPPAEIRTFDALARALPEDPARARAAEEALRSAGIEDRGGPPPDDGW